MHNLKLTDSCHLTIVQIRMYYPMIICIVKVWVENSLTNSQTLLAMKKLPNLRVIHTQVCMYVRTYTYVGTYVCNNTCTVHVDNKVYIPSASTQHQPLLSPSWTTEVHGQLFPWLPGSQVAEGLVPTLLGFFDFFF